MTLAVLLQSTVVAALVAALVSLRTSERKIAIENITQQRQLWREKIRLKASEAIKAFQSKDRDRLKELYVDFQLMLNPVDPHDISILDTLWRMQQEDLPELTLEFSEKLSLLLKHDWERAKREAKPWFNRPAEVDRMSYENFNSMRGGS